MLPVSAPKPHREERRPQLVYELGPFHIKTKNPLGPVQRVLSHPDIAITNAICAV